MEFALVVWNSPDARVDSMIGEYSWLFESKDTRCCGYTQEVINIY